MKRRDVTRNLPNSAPPSPPPGLGASGLPGPGGGSVVRLDHPVGGASCRDTAGRGQSRPRQAAAPAAGSPLAGSLLWGLLFGLAAALLVAWFWLCSLHFFSWKLMNFHIIQACVRQTAARQLILGADTAAAHALTRSAGADLPHRQHVEVAVGEGEAPVFYTGQPEAEGQDGEREGEEAGDDEEQSPQSEADGSREGSVSRRRPPGRRDEGRYPFCLFSSLK